MQIGAILGYVAVQIAIALWVARSTASHTDYLVAGRSLGVLAVAMSLFATWFAAETVVAVGAEVASHGMPGARLDPLGFGLGLLLVGLLVAAPLRKGEHVTLAGFMGHRFGPRAELLTAFVIAGSATVWAAAQLYALATILSATAQIGFLPALIGAAGVVIIYALLGGLKADIVTDIIQGIILSAGLIGFVFIAIGAAGGIGPALDLIPTEKLALHPADESWSAGFEIWLIPIFAAIAAQEVIARVLAARSPSVARRGTLLGTAIFLTMGAIPIFLGLIGPGLSAALGYTLGEGDAFMPQLAEQALPNWLFIVFSGALLSAIFSTVDSALIAVSAVSIDSGYRRLRPDMTPREALWAARIATLSAGLLAIAIAASGDSLRQVVIDSAAIGGVLALPLILALVFGQLLGPKAPHLDWAATAAIAAQIIVLTVPWGGEASFLAATIIGAAVFALSAAGLKYMGHTKPVNLQ